MLSSMADAEFLGSSALSEMLERIDRESETHHQGQNSRHREVMEEKHCRKKKIDLQSTDWTVNVRKIMPSIENPNIPFDTMCDLYTYLLV